MTFENRINSAIKESISACNYKPTAFIHMISDLGTLKAVKKLINTPKVSDGYVRLFEKQRLDLTVEAIALENEWNELFTIQELNICRKRLHDFGYEIPESKIEVKKSNRWTYSELNAAVESYIEMLSKQEKNIPYKKSEYNENLRKGILKERTKASVEFRMQNISAVFQGLHLNMVNGYLPAKNVGINVINEILKILEDLHYFDDNFIENDQGLIDNTFTQGEIAQPKGTKYPKKKNQQITIFSRNPIVKSYVLQRAKGKCELCGSTPFLNTKNIPFLEVHHLKPLSQGGQDTASNAVALCPNCHRELHYGSESDTKTEYLIRKFYKE